MMCFCRASSVDNDQWPVHSVRGVCLLEPLADYCKIPVWSDTRFCLRLRSFCQFKHRYLTFIGASGEINLHSVRGVSEMGGCRSDTDSQYTRCEVCLGPASRQSGSDHHTLYHVCPRLTHPEHHPRRQPWSRSGNYRRKRDTVPDTNQLLPKTLDTVGCVPATAAQKSGLPATTRKNTHSASVNRAVWTVYLGAIARANPHPTQGISSHTTSALLTRKWSSRASISSSPSSPSQCTHSSGTDSSRRSSWSRLRSSVASSQISSTSR